MFVLRERSPRFCQWVIGFNITAANHLEKSYRLGPCSSAEAEEFRRVFFVCDHKRRQIGLSTYGPKIPLAIQLFLMREHARFVLAWTERRERKNDLR